MDVALVQEIGFDPNVCALCRSHNSPYVLTRVRDLQVPTEEGPRWVKGIVAICVGDDEHPGCLASLTREAGGLPPHEAKALRAEHERVVAELEGRIQRLDIELEEAQLKQGPRVVAVDELLDRASVTAH